MKRTKLIFVSDIHFTGRRPENEGVVIRAFLVDLENHLRDNKSDEICLVIGGDLVQSADNAESYALLYEQVLEPLMRMGINKDRIFVVPGNHDVERAWITRKKLEYAPFIKQSFNEKKFNDFVEENPDYLVEKFTNYLSFANRLGLCDVPNIGIGYSAEINDEWSIYGINTALTSFAGVYDEENPELQMDAKRLQLFTRDLYNWVGKNSKKKVLVMHHPFSELSDWASAEIMKLCKLHFDLVLTGHVHEQNFLCNTNQSDSYVWCQAPQLFTDKGDKLGYAIIDLLNETVDKVYYREWFEKRNAFRAGLDFTVEEDGVIKVSNTRSVVKDSTLVKLEECYYDTMSVYGEEPPTWVERFFSLDRFDRSFQFKTKDLFTEDDLLSLQDKNVKIITPAQYGLTSFAWHYLLRLWREKKEFGLYLDCELVKRGKIEKTIERQLLSFGKIAQDVERVVIDNWNITDKDAIVILNKLSSTFPGKPILILCPLLEKKLAETEIVTNRDYDFVNMFMAPLQTYQVRKMVCTYNNRLHIGDEDSILQRLNSDIDNFNMHRSPLNYISLLEVFSRSFDENPVNRTELISKLLSIIFDNEIVPTYKSLPDVKDCEFAIGYFCEQMIKNEEFYFSESEICDSLQAFCKKQKISLDIGYLFQILLNNQIICQYDINIYGFRFAFWVYYFAAKRMAHSQSFSSFILENENYVHYPEILEFYTGGDRSREDAAKIVSEDMEKLTSHVHDKVGIPDNLNPFRQLKYSPSDAQIESAIKQLDDSLKKTSLPSNIKDAIVDESYNPSLPFHQEVYKVFKNYSVNYLQEMISIASKVVRNSDYIAPDIKDRLFNAITDAWFNTIRVIYLMAPALARDSKAGYDGFNLFLTDSYSKYDNDPKQKLIQIIVNIPNNILRWYKDDIYSAKLADIIYDKIKSESNPVIKHILIGMIIREQPAKWDDVVIKYLSDVDAKSFYFGDTIDSLKEMYACGVLSDQNLAKTKSLILLAYTKLCSGGRISAGDIKKLNLKNILPKRCVDEDQEEGNE